MKRTGKILVRILSKIRVRGEFKCWRWTGATKDGYAVYSKGRGTRRVHRILHESLISPCPEDLVPDHLCRDRSCVHPNHVEWVTETENKVRGVGFAGQNSRKDRCPNNHRYDMLISVGGKSPRRFRACSRCRATANTKWRKRHAEQRATT